MKKIRELLKEKRWRWTAGGFACLLTAALGFSLLSEMGVRADEISLGNTTVDLHPIEGENSVYWVETPEQLHKLGNASEGTAGLTFRLKNDLTISSITAPAAGTFEGVFDGNGHIVTFEDVNITVTDEVPSNASTENGLLFGNVSGTVQNLIVEIADEDASYTRKTKTPVKEHVQIPVYGEHQNPIIGDGEVISGLSKDPAVLDKVEEIFSLESDTATGNKVHTLQEKGTKTTIYEADTPGEDYFGLICGNVSGTVQEIYLTGNAVSVTREELESQNYSQSVQSGYREETYSYSQSIGTETEEAENTSISIPGTVYVAENTYTEEVENEKLLLSVRAVKAAVKGETITYKINIANHSQNAYRGVEVSASKDGTWSDTFPVDIEPSGSVNLEFYYTAENIAENEASIDFTVTGTSGSSAVLAKVTEVKTLLLEPSGTEKYSSAQELELRVTAPEAVEHGKDAVYQMSVRNNGTADYSEVKIQASENGVWNTDSTFSLTAGAYKNITFTCPEVQNTEQVILDFEVSAKNGTTEEMVKAAVSDISTDVFNVTQVSKETSLEGLALSVESPESKDISENRKSISYKVTVKNTSDQTVEKVTLTSSKEGKWDRTQGTVHEMTQIPADSSLTVEFLYTYTEADAAAGKTDIVFEAVKETSDQSVKLKIDNKTVQLFDSSVTVEKFNSKGLAMDVQGPQYVIKGEPAVYQVEVSNTGEETCGIVHFSSDLEGVWSKNDISLEKGESDTVTFTLTPSGTEEQIQPNFKVTADEKVTTTVSDIVTTIMDIAETETDESQHGLQVTVSAPKAAEKGGDVIFKVLVDNTGTEDCTDIQVRGLGANGTWDSAESFSLAAGADPKELTYTCSSSDVSESLTVYFRVSGMMTVTQENDTGSTVSQQQVDINGPTVKVQIFDTSQAVMKNQKEGLSLSVSAPKAAKKGKDITYNLSVSNTGNTDYSGITLTASAGEWNLEDTLAVNAGESKTFTVTLPASETASDSVQASFRLTVSSELEVAVDNVNTAMFSTASNTLEKLLDGLVLAVSAPDKKGIGDEKSIRYQLTISNTSQNNYADLKITAANPGEWRTEGSETTVSGDTFTLAALESGGSENIIFDYRYTEEDEAARLVSMDFSVSGESDGSTLGINVSGVETELTNTGASSSAVIKSGLQFYVTAPKEAPKNSEIMYRLKLVNTGDNTLSNVKLESSKDGSWNMEQEFSIDSREMKELTFTCDSGSADVLETEFLVKGENAENEEVILSKVSGVTTNLYDASEEGKEQQVPGIKARVISDYAKKDDGQRELIYGIKVTNTSETEYEDVIVSASKAGHWDDGDDAEEVYDLGVLAAGEERFITFLYECTDDDIGNGNISLDFSVTGSAGDARIQLNFAKITTKIMEVVPDVRSAESANGLKLTLELDNNQIFKGEDFRYTLILENTNRLTEPFILSKHLEILTDLTAEGWVLEETDAEEFSLEEGKQILPVGKRAVLKKNVEGTVSGSGVSNVLIESLTLKSALKSEAYQYVYDQANSAPQGGEFIADSTEPVTSGAGIISGNILYAGGVAGESSGSIREIKQTVNITTTEMSHKCIAGGIGGKTENSGGWSDIYMTGTVNGAGKYDGAGAVYPGNSAKTQAEANQLAGNSDNWKTYTKCVKTGEQFEAQSFGELSWLVKEENDTDTYFAFAEPVEKAIRLSVVNEKRLTNREISYIAAYNARRSMNDLTEDMLYLSDGDRMELGDSGYYRMLSVYGTDGFYHYCMPAVLMSDAKWCYPYCEDTEQNPYSISNQQVVRSSTNPLEDEVQISFGSATGGDAYYDITSAEVVPNLGADTNTEHAEISSEGTVKLPFVLDRVQYRIVPVVDGHIYPTQTTKAFSPADKKPLPKPTVTCYDYYDEDGNRKEYVELGSGPYEAGTDMRLIPAEDEINNKTYGFFYLFTTMAPGEDWDENGRYIGSDGTFMNAAEEYIDSAVIPKTLEGEETVYLYVNVSKKNYSSQLYVFGPFSVTKGEQLTATLTSSGEVMDSYVALDGDILKISGEPEGTTIEYMVADSPQTSFSWEEYSEEGIVMNQTAGGYVYARIKYNDTKYSRAFLFDYSFGGICADPRVTPNTGVSSAGEGAAATVGAATTVTLASRTPEAEIFYVISDSSQSFYMERVNVLPEDVTEDGTISKDHYKYFKVGGRWYRTSFTDAEPYSDGIQLVHQRKDAQLMYVSAIALADGYDASAVLEYVYRVQPVQQVSNPEAAFETRHMPGGEEVEVASVKKGAAISFFSVTPEAELYYDIGSGTEPPQTKIPDDGIVVDGNYGNNFVVRVQAKKNGLLDSEIITYVYSISDQEMASAPTATPGTTEDVPTTVIPGNKILLSTVTKEASIYYTTDGSSPKVKEQEDGTFAAENEQTRLYDPNAGIEMPLDGSGYFSITAVAVKQGLAKSEEVHLIYIYPSAVLKPYANIDSGKVELNTKVILKNLTEEAVIYYEVAYGEEVPKEPTLSSSVFSQEYPFTITQKTTIKAIAAKDGVKSETATFVYEPMKRLGVPEASIESGSIVSSGTTLELKAEEGAFIYYTTDGSDPTDSGNGAVISGNTLTLNGDSGSQVTIKAFAQAADRSQSEVITFTYQFSQNIGGVTASIPTGSVVSNGTKVNLMSDVTDAEIYYTTDGTSPVERGRKGTVVEIKGTPGSSITLKAVAVVNNEPGMVTTFIYQIKTKPTAPTASPAGGTLTVAKRITLNSGADMIYYTVDGTDPTKSSALYSEPILINRTTTLKAIAISEDGEASEVATFVYTAADKAAVVTSNAADGSVLKPGESVKLSTNTDNAVIYYSTNGTEPNLDNLDHMLVYNGESIEINRSVTIHAVAYREDLRLSDTAVWNYNVEIIPAVEQKKEDELLKAEEGLRDTDASALKRETQREEQPNAKAIHEEVNSTQVTYTENVLPGELKLETTKEENSPLAVEKVKGTFGEENTVLGTYRFKVKRGTTVVQPTGQVEIAIPIPEGYENAALTIAMLEEGHNLKTLETRREIGMLYAKTMNLGSCVIIGPEREASVIGEFPFLLLLEIFAGLILCIGIIYYVKEKIKKRRKKR